MGPTGSKSTEWGSHSTSVLWPPPHPGMCLVAERSGSDTPTHPDSSVHSSPNTHTHTHKLAAQLCIGQVTARVSLQPTRIQLLCAPQGRGCNTICLCVCVSVTSVMSDSLRPHGLQPARLLCPWGFPCMNTRVGCHFLLQGSFLAQHLAVPISDVEDVPTEGTKSQSVPGLRCSLPTPESKTPLLSRPCSHLLELGNSAQLQSA